MAWAAPATVVTGDTLTAAWANQYIRDNTSFLHDPPACRLYNSVSISVANDSDVALTFNSEFYDPDGMHSTASNTSRITATIAGKYDLKACVAFDPDADGYRQAHFRINGVLSIGLDSRTSISGSPGLLTWVSISTDYALAAGDYVELIVRHTAGAALNVVKQGTPPASPVFSAAWIRG